MNVVGISGLGMGAAKRPANPKRVVWSLEVEVDGSEFDNTDSILEIHDYVQGLVHVALAQSERYVGTVREEMRFLTEEELAAIGELDAFVADMPLAELAQQYGYQLRGLRTFPQDPSRLRLQAYKPGTEPFKVHAFDNRADLTAFVLMLQLDEGLS